MAPVVKGSRARENVEEQQSVATRGFAIDLGRRGETVSSRITKALGVFAISSVPIFAMSAAAFADYPPSQPPTNPGNPPGNPPPTQTTPPPTTTQTTSPQNPPTSPSGGGGTTTNPSGSVPSSPAHAGTSTPSPTTSPSGSGLAFTGADITATVAVGAGALGLGGLLVVGSRRKRAATR